MDNLDRTNVMQATLAKWTLNKQLQSLGILPENASIDGYEGLSQDFRDSKRFSTSLLVYGVYISTRINSLGRPRRLDSQVVWRIGCPEIRFHQAEQAN
jgi:hypothetical protein